MELSLSPFQGLSIVLKPGDILNVGTGNTLELIVNPLQMQGEVTQPRYDHLLKEGEC